MSSQSGILPAATTKVLRIFPVTEHQECCQTGLPHQTVGFGLYRSICCDFTPRMSTWYASTGKKTLYFNCHKHSCVYPGFTATSYSHSVKCPCQDIASIPLNMIFNLIN